MVRFDFKSLVNFSENREGGGGGTRPLKIAIGIATVGRPTVLLETLSRLERQTRAPDLTIVCAPSADDFAGVEKAFPGVNLVKGPRGLAHQRNAILQQLTEFDVVLFLDDDFVPAADYIEQMEALFGSNDDIVMTTGKVLADGILGPGLGFDEADAVLADDGHDGEDLDLLEDVFNGYGCNMSIRLQPVRENGLAFDEQLPLYAWLEDVDFSRQLAAFGRIVKAGSTRGVHLGVKSGRQAGLRLGYSQIANPVFLMRKGTCTWRKGFFLMSRNVAANTVKSVRPEPWVDRTGRLAGNARAAFDVLRGRVDPGRILSL